MGHAATEGGLFGDVLRLALGADKNDDSAFSSDFFSSLFGLKEEFLGFNQIEDVNAAADGIQIAAHFGVPTAGLVAKVTTGVEEIAKR